ncbi:hypothetical protein ACFVUY_24520 [Kitasatospora sp. NPDC058063]|uniref:hypothetical protein n=1 Tax=unclassified Kitasatospora TaxID=2633591 RepID=UPI0036DDAD59
MSASTRTKFARFLAVPALAMASTILATAPASAGGLSIGVNGATVADAGRTLNVSVSYRCLPIFEWVKITVQATQSAVSGVGSVRLPCTGGETVTIPVGVTSPGDTWIRSSVNVVVHIYDAELDRGGAAATVVAN